MQKQPVDAVITWVNGQDVVHAKKLANYLSKTDVAPEEVDPTRFNQCDEITYCVYSILRFAPWVKTIYIVTDEQIPPIMNQLMGTPYEKRVKLVDHRDIFYGYEQYLPTFNSLTIEMMLWRIPGLSNQFIYFNDDCALIRAVSYEDFFCENKVVLRGKWRNQSDNKLSYHFKKWLSYLLKRREGALQADEGLPVRNSISIVAHKGDSAQQDLYRIIQENTAKLAGRQKSFFQMPHAPTPLQKSTFENYFQKFPDLLVQNLQYPFRNQAQFWVISLMQYWEIEHENVVFDNSLETVYVNGAYHSLKTIQQRLANADRKKNIAFVCMQSIDQAPEMMKSMMLAWLDKRIKEKL